MQALHETLGLGHQAIKETITDPIYHALNKATQDMFDHLSPQDDTSSLTKKHCASDQKKEKKPEGEGKKPEEEDEYKQAIYELYAILENDDKA
ncbi:hypothetical protein FQN53_002278 [Emmonsiellopsis sp. PD_33]|nr:hypothetical protein FQN53_002278 [Emmonsiellopsis sp. PD_33]